MKRKINFLNSHSNGKIKRKYVNKLYKKLETKSDPKNIPFLKLFLNLIFVYKIWNIINKNKIKYIKSMTYSNTPPQVEAWISWILNLPTK